MGFEVGLHLGGLVVASRRAPFRSKLIPATIGACAGPNERWRST
jgi:hypothetical protein